MRNIEINNFNNMYIKITMLISCKAESRVFTRYSPLRQYSVISFAAMVLISKLWKWRAALPELHNRVSSRKICVAAGSALRCNSCICLTIWRISLADIALTKIDSTPPDWLPGAADFSESECDLHVRFRIASIGGSHPIILQNNSSIIITIIWR